MSDAAADTGASGATLRLDKWLWYARFIKTRSQATAFCRSGRIRVNRDPVRKSNHAIRPGDVLTFELGPRIRVIRVVALGVRRGPAPEAQTLYEDLSPPVPARADLPADGGAREPGSGRPTKRDRRAIDRLQAPLQNGQNEAENP